MMLYKSYYYRFPGTLTGAMPKDVGSDRSPMMDVITRQAQLAPLITRTFSASPSLSSSTSPASTSLGYSTSSLSSFAGNSFSATPAAFFAKSSSTRFSHYI